MTQPAPERLTEILAELDATRDALDETERLRARITVLEAELALLRGSVAPRPAEDEPAVYAHDVPPNAPR